MLALSLAGWLACLLACCSSAAHRWLPEDFVWFRLVCSETLLSLDSTLAMSSLANVWINWRQRSRRADRASYSHEQRTITLTPATLRLGNWRQPRQCWRWDRRTTIAPRWCRSSLVRLSRRLCCRRWGLILATTAEGGRLLACLLGIDASHDSADVEIDAQR